VGDWRKWSRVAFNLAGAAASVAACAYTGNWTWATTAAAFGIGAGTSIGLVWLDDGRARSDRDDAAIETLRELLLHRAKVNADSSRAWSAVNHQLRADYAELADSAERRACIAIALALLL